MFSERT